MATLNVQDASLNGRDRRSERNPDRDFGTYLRRAREQQGITLRQIAITTKISMSALEALEKNDASRLPGGIFSRAFVRSYASEVGLDPEQTVREFIERFPVEGGITISQHTPDAHEESFENRRQIAGALLRLVFVSIPIVGVLLYYTMFRPPSENPSPATESPAATIGDRAPSPTAVVPAVQPFQPPLNATDSARPAAPAPAAIPPASVPAVNERGLVLDLRPTGPCWVTVTADGQRVMSRLMQPGERVTQRAEKDVILQVGDAGAFGFAINNLPGRPLGRSGQVVVVQINAQNFRTFLQP